MDDRTRLHDRIEALANVRFRTYGSRDPTRVGFGISVASAGIGIPRAFASNAIPTFEIFRRRRRRDPPEWTIEFMGPLFCHFSAVYRASFCN
jgi:hypothetical protein